MSREREPEFTVTDRRRFTSEGESTPEQTPQPTETSENAAKRVDTAGQSPSPQQPITSGSENAASEAPEPAAEYEAPTAEERKAQEDAFHASTEKLDQQMESALGSRAQDLQMSFERFVASIYMSALMQLGLMREQGGPAPQVDLVGGRQTIDTLSILAEKTKGNLSMQEDNLLQNCLYELRMAYVEVTNAITRAPQPGAGGLGGRK